MKLKIAEEKLYYRSSRTKRFCYARYYDNTYKDRNIIGNYIYVFECINNEKKDWIGVGKKLGTLDMFLTDFGEEYLKESTVCKIYDEVCDYFYMHQNKEKNFKKIEDKKILIEIKNPKTCGKCPFYRVHQYQNHLATETECECTLGSMKMADMRGKSFENSKYSGCLLYKYIK